MKMKLTVLTTAIILVALSFTGCDYGRRINDAKEAFLRDNPDAKVMPVDEDGDGTTDFQGVDADGDGDPDTDSAGKPVEVPNTRAVYAEAKAADFGMAEILALLGAAGIPITGAVSAWWGRRKPIQRLTALACAFEKAKQDDSPKGMITVSKASLELYLQEIPGFVKMLDEIRAHDKARRKLAQAG